MASSADSLGRPSCGMLLTSAPLSKARRLETHATAVRRRANESLDFGLHGLRVIVALKTEDSPCPCWLQAGGQEQGWRGLTLIEFHQKHTPS